MHKSILIKSVKIHAHANSTTVLCLTQLSKSQCHQDEENSYPFFDLALIGDIKTLTVWYSLTYSGVSQSFTWSVSYYNVIAFLELLSETSVQCGDFIAIFKHLYL